jgi:glycopeptide antibiotics resistance protein
MSCPVGRIRAMSSSSASVVQRRPLGGLFAFYLLLLAWLLLWKFEVPWIGNGALRRIKLVPFLANAGAGASSPREVAANVVFFVPFGLYLGLLAPTWTRWTRIGVLAGASVIVEVTQYVLAVGGSDITDVIANTAGGLAGIGLLAAIRRKLRDRTETVMARTCVVGTVLALALVVVFLASGLRYASSQSAAPSPTLGHGGRQ